MVLAHMLLGLLDELVVRLGLDDCAAGTVDCFQPGRDPAQASARRLSRVSSRRNAVALVNRIARKPSASAA